MVDIARILRQITVDERIPCRYSGALSLGPANVNGDEWCADVHVPFRPRRIVMTKPGITVKSVHIGHRSQIITGYVLEMPSDLLLPSAHPIEWDGIDMCLPGMRITIRFGAIPDGCLILGDAL